VLPDGELAIGHRRVLGGGAGHYHRGGVMVTNTGFP
jgi:hypothetical protein